MWEFFYISRAAADKDAVPALLIHVVFRQHLLMNWWQGRAAAFAPEPR